MNNYYKKIVIALLISIPMLGAGVYVFKPTTFNTSNIGSTIISFDKVKHGSFIRAMFADKENWDWLVAEGTPYDVNYMIEHQGYPQFSSAKHNLFIDVSMYNGTATGFVAYLTTSSVSAKILFLFVDKPYRGQGWGYKLLNHAVAKLRAQGTSTIELVTRVDNAASQKLYRRYGFIQSRKFGFKNEFVEYILKK